MAGEFPTDELVPGLSSRSGPAHSPARGDHSYGVPAVRTAGDSRAKADKGVQGARRPYAHELQHVPPMNANSSDLALFQKRVADVQGHEFWRSLEDLAARPEFYEWLEREHPRQATAWQDIETGENRRHFLKLIGASLALAGLTGCTRQPTEFIMPYVRQPEELIPGRPLFYATAMPLGGFATGLLVESHEGRPTKAEGNPNHPASLGACDAYSQGAILGLYDPDRSQALSFEGEISSWARFLTSMREVLTQQQAKRGAGLRILTESISSPTLADQLRSILSGLPEAKWHTWDPAAAHMARGGAQLAFGQPVNTYYNISNAD